MNEIPQTRWATGGEATSGYLERFSASIDAGIDVDGEARLADALIDRGSRILDAGAGMGRVGIALQRKGHEVLAAEPDASLVAVSSTSSLRTSPLRASRSSITSVDTTWSPSPTTTSSPC